MDNLGNGSMALLSWVRRTLKGHPLVMSEGPTGAGGRVEMLDLDPGGHFPAIGVTIVPLPMFSVIPSDPLWEVAQVSVMAIDLDQADASRTIELAKVIKAWLHNGAGATSMTVSEGTVQTFSLTGLPPIFEKRRNKLQQIEFYNGYTFRAEVK